MPRLLSLPLLIAACLALGGCQVLASVFEERTLRLLAIFVAVAAVLGFLISRMRR